MKKSLCVCILMLLYAPLLFAQGGELLYMGISNCYTFGEESSVKIRSFCIEEPTVLAYSVPHALITTEAATDEMVTLFSAGGWGDPRAFVGSFSDDELVEIIDQGSFEKGIDLGKNSIGKLSLPLITADSEAGKAIADLIFTLTDAYVIMKNPYDPAKDVYLSGIAYVKFKGTALIEVPPVE